MASVEAGRQTRISSIQMRDSGLALGAKVEVVRRDCTLEMFWRKGGQYAITDYI